MNRWLAEECKWAREKAIECRRKAEELSDAEWRGRRIRRIEASSGDLINAVNLHLRLLNERRELEDADELADQIRRYEADAERWETIAAEQSARLEQTESEQEALLP